MDLIDYKQATEIVPLAETTLRIYVSRKKIPFYKIGKEFSSSRMSWRNGSMPGVFLRGRDVEALAAAFAELQRRTAALDYGEVILKISIHGGSSDCLSFQNHEKLNRTEKMADSIWRGNTFTILSDELLTDERRVTRNGLGAALGIAKYLNKKRTAFPSYTAISKIARQSVSSTKRGIKELEELGYIEKIKRKKPGKNPGSTESND